MTATIEQIRMLTQDNGTPPLIPDADIQLILDLESNVYRAAAMVSNSLAAYFAKKVSLTAGPVKLQSTQKFEHYTDLADQYNQRAREGGGNVGGGGIGTGLIITGTSISTIEDVRSDPDRYDSAFYRGLDENPPADNEGEPNG